MSLPAAGVPAVAPLRICPEAFVESNGPPIKSCTNPRGATEVVG